MADDVKTENKTENKEPIVEEEVEVEYKEPEVRQNPGPSIDDATKTAKKAIDIKKVAFAAGGLIAPMVIPKIIANYSGQAMLAEGLVGLLVGFLAIVAGTMAVKHFASEAAADDFMTAGVAGLAVSGIMMALAKIQERVALPATPPAPAADGVGASRHELYDASTAISEAVNELSAVSKDIISPSMGGIDNIGSGIIMG